MIPVNLKVSQIKNLIEFIEIEFIESLRRDPEIDNVDYIMDMMLALKNLRAALDQNSVPYPLENEPYKAAEIAQERTEV